MYYFENRMVLSDIYNSPNTNYGKLNTAKMTGKTEDNIYKQIGNKVLKYLKDNSRDLDALSFKLRRGNRRRDILKLPFVLSDSSKHIMVLTGQLSFMLKRANENFENEHGSSVFGRGGDLSKEAIKEMLYKLEDKGGIEY